MDYSGVVTIFSSVGPTSFWTLVSIHHLDLLMQKSALVHKTSIIRIKWAERIKRPERVITGVATPGEGAFSTYTFFKFLSHWRLYICSRLSRSPQWHSRIAATALVVGCRGRGYQPPKPKMSRSEIFFKKSFLISYNRHSSNSMLF